MPGLIRTQKTKAKAEGRLLPTSLSTAQSTTCRPALALGITSPLQTIIIQKKDGLVYVIPPHFKFKLAHSSSETERSKPVQV